MSWVLGGLGLSKAFEGQVEDKVMVKSRLNGIRRRGIIPDWKNNSNWSKKQSEIFLGITGFELRISIVFDSPFGGAVNKKKK